MSGSAGNERRGGVGFHESEVLDPRGRGIPGVGGGGYRVMQEMDGVVNRGRLSLSYGQGAEEHKRW